MNFFQGCCSSKDGAEPAKKSNTEKDPENGAEADGLAVEGKSILEKKPESPAKNSADKNKLEEAQ